MPTTLITGASSGIGLAAAEALAARGHRVLLLCRNPAAGAKALEQVRRHGQAELVLADLADPGAIASVPGQVAAFTDRLDVLVHNAGLYVPTRKETVDGHEMTFAVNHLGPFRLTNALTDALRAAARPRVVVTSSRSHAEGEIVLDDLNRRKRPWSAYFAYSDSKLANLLYARALARRMPDVAVHALHPGVVGTEWGQDEPGWMQRLFRFARPLMPTPAQGARTTVFLADDPAALQDTGGYWVKCRKVTPHRRGADDAMADGLWEASAALG